MMDDGGIQFWQTYQQQFTEIFELEQLQERKNERTSKTNGSKNRPTEHKVNKDWS